MQTGEITNDVIAAFTTAAQLGCVDMLRMMLGLGVPVNATDAGGWTALHAAAQAGHDEAVALLLKSGVRSTYNTRT